MHEITRSGWLEVVTGSMFSGKTEELLRRLRRAEIAGQDVAAFTPAIDDPTFVVGAEESYAACCRNCHTLCTD